MLPAALVLLHVVPAELVLRRMMLLVSAVVCCLLHPRSGGHLWQLLPGPGAPLKPEIFVGGGGEKQRNFPPPPGPGATN